MSEREAGVKLIMDALIFATGKICHEYFQIPVAGEEDPLFRERVYCYELYHQLRECWPSIPHRLTGELDKHNHPWLYRGHLDYSKPDFTIHEPGRMENNLVVIEVKPPNASNGDVLHDLQKLHDFCRFGNYEIAFYLVYGLDKEGLKQFAGRCKRVAWAAGVDLTRILLFGHTHAGSKAFQIAWPGHE